MRKTINVFEACLWTCRALDQSEGVEAAHSLFPEELEYFC